ncbi:MAG: hypothetical protein IPL89_04765 [Acidobacteria bacterium]|nr:hypothetical protein [Acidobacteriota bacterium]
MTPRPDGRRAAFRAAAATALAALAAAAAGLPLAAPGLVEEWSFRWAFDRGQPWIAPDLLVAMPTRPLTGVPHALGRALTPDSFLGEKLVLLALLAGTAVAAAALLARFVPVPAAAAAGAVLAAMAPADSALFLTRDLPNHAAVLFTILAIVLLARAAERRRPGAAAGMVLCEAAALGLYESPILVLLAAPALLPLLVHGGRRTPRLLLALWLLAPLAFVIRALVLLARGGTYVTSLWVPGSESTLARAAGTIGAVIRMAGREFAAPLREGGAALAAARGGDLAAVLLLALAAAVLVRGEGSAVPVRLRVVFGAGLGLLVLGVLPFAAAPVLREESRRVHLLASIGAGVATAAALAALRRPSLRIGASVTLVALSAAAGGARRDHVAASAERVGGLVRSLAEGAPSPPPGTVLLLADSDGPPRTEDVLGLTITDVHLADALRVVHQQADLLVYVYGRDLRYRWNGTPEAREDGVTVRWGDGSASLVPWEKVAVFREDASGRVTRLDELPRGAFPLATPPDMGRLIPQTGPPPPRLETLCPPLNGMPARAPSRRPAGAGGPA